MSFLKHYGLDIENIPLGPVPIEQTDPKIQFVEGWPILFDKNSNVEIICSAWDFPTIISKKIGQGQLILISDSYFLLSQNLD